MPVCEQAMLFAGLSFGMPSRAAQIIAFVSVFAISALLHRFVYLNLKRVILRDYPMSGPTLAKWTRILFLVMDSPFLFLYFRSGMAESFARVTTGILYPFAVWQAIMLMWAVILVPFTLWRRTKSSRLFRRSSAQEIEFDPQLEVVTE